jgi:hypothetical protein
MSFKAVLLNPSALNRALLITRDRTAVFEEFATAVRRSPEIMECHMMAGGFEYLIKARVRAMKTYRAFLRETLVRLPGIRQTQTLYRYGRSQEHSGHPGLRSILPLRGEFLAQGRHSNSRFKQSLPSRRPVCSEWILAPV